MTRFPKLPKLSAADLQKLPPQARVALAALKKQEDDWGHLPPQIAAGMVGIDPANVSPLAVELHAKAKGTDPVVFAASKAFHRWGALQELEPEAYDAAVQQVLSERHGY